MPDPQPVSLHTMRLATKRIVAVLDALADPRLSWLAEHAFANPLQIPEYVDQYQRIEREHKELREKFASLVAARYIGGEDTVSERSDGIAALFDRFKKTEQQIFRAIVNSLVQHVVATGGHEIPLRSQRNLRYEIMAVLSRSLLVGPFLALMDEHSVSPEQLSKLVRPIRNQIWDGSAIAADLPKHGPEFDELTLFVERQVADLIANGLARLRSGRSVEPAKLAELATDAEDLIRQHYKIPKNAQALLDELHRAAQSCVELTYQLTRSNVACILWLPEPGTPFNSEAHRAAVGTSELGSVRLPLFPALTIGSVVVERAMVLTDVETGPSGAMDQ